MRRRESFYQALLRLRSPDRDHNQICELDPITRDEIRKHLSKLKLYEVPGPDSIPNIILTKCFDLTTDRLYHIYMAMVEMGFFYEPWKQFITVGICKPGKLKYNTPKAYRPIALLNPMVKALMAVLAEQLMYYTEKFSLLPANHFSGRKGWMAADTLHLLTHQIVMGAWQKGKIMVVLFLDIEGAFPNTDNKQLLKNLQKRGIPGKLISFVANMLCDRTTTLKLDDFTSAV